MDVFDDEIDKVGPCDSQYDNSDPDIEVKYIAQEEELENI